MRRRPARDLRTAIDCLPLETRKAMLTGVEANRIIVGAYTDRKGGVCPMLAAHRNGGRTSLASIALDELPELQEVAREVKKKRLPRLFHRFDEYERAVAELGVIRALSPQDERTAPQAPRSFAKS